VRLLKQSVTAIIVGAFFGVSLFAYAFFYSSRTIVPVFDISIMVLLASVLAASLPLADAILYLFPNHQGGAFRVASVTVALALTNTLALVVINAAGVNFLEEPIPESEIWFIPVIVASGITWVLLESIRFSLYARYLSHPPPESQPVRSVLIAAAEERNICLVCNREFPTHHGLLVHQGRMHKVAVA
jgi:hypothetical protein